MMIGAAEVTRQIHAARSLKDKRRTVHSVLQKLRNRRTVSAAEVYANDSWTTATIGIAVVSGDAETARRLLERAMEFVERAAPEAEVVDAHSDVFDFRDL